MDDFDSCFGRNISLGLLSYHKDRHGLRVCAYNLIFNLNSYMPYQQVLVTGWFIKKIKKKAC